MGTHPWKPVREKKQERRPNWVAKKMELANTKVLKKTRYLITGSSSPGLHRAPVFRGVHHPGSEAILRVATRYLCISSCCNAFICTDQARRSL